MPTTFYNELNISVLQSVLHSGDPSGLASLSAATPMTIPALRSAAVMAPPYDVLRIMAPEKAAVVESTLRQISALSDYVQALCGYLAGNEAFEPAHAVICKLLRTGADFERAATTNPIHVAAAAIAPLCPHPDVDGVLKKKSLPARARRASNYCPQGYCFRFNRASCTSQSCGYRHLCAICHSPGHGRSTCPRST